MSYIHVKVSVGMRKENFQKINEDHFKVSVKEKAERNMANIRIIEIIAEHFKKPKSKVRIINGHQHPSKLIAVD